MLTAIGFSASTSGQTGFVGTGNSGGSIFEDKGLTDANTNEFICGFQVYYGSVYWTYRYCDCSNMFNTCSECTAVNGYKIDNCPLICDGSVEGPVYMSNPVGLNRIDIKYCKSCARVLS